MRKSAFPEMQQQGQREKYRDKTYDRMELSLPKGLKDEITSRVKAGAASSNTAYVVEAIKEKMEREQG